ncbi:hypothetical protein J6P59_08005 [bacterium]|nr:hypothetical protein [bacterium]MBO7043778.1 hypothetical protein [bacterium]
MTSNDPKTHDKTSEVSPSPSMPAFMQSVINIVLASVGSTIMSAQLATLAAISAALSESQSLIAILISFLKASKSFNITKKPE